MFSLSSFISYMPILFMFALFMFVSSILLKSGKLFLAQLTLTFIFSIEATVTSPAIAAVLGIIQIILSVFVLYRIFKAIAYNYDLVLEKTNQKTRKYTAHGNDGTTKSFL